MTHYDALGVRRSATQAEIRHAYLRLAREHHPDHHAGSRADVREVAEREMRAINEAWAELGDPERRRRYDESLDRAPWGAVADDGPAPSWRPYEDPWGTADEPDERLDDSAGRRPTGGRLLAMVPVGSLVLGVAALALGVVMQARPLLAVGFAAVAFAVLLFVAVPIAVVLETRRHDRL